MNDAQRNAVGPRPTHDEPRAQQHEGGAGGLPAAAADHALPDGLREVEKDEERDVRQCRRRQPLRAHL